MKKKRKRILDPEPAFYEENALEIAGGLHRRAVTVRKVRKIAKYSTETIQLVTQKETLLFCGRELHCDILESGALRLSGELERIEFLTGGKK